MLVAVQTWPSALGRRLYRVELPLSVDQSVKEKCLKTLIYIEYIDENAVQVQFHATLPIPFSILSLQPRLTLESEMLGDFLRAIICKIHQTCDSRVFIISSYFNQLKIKVILEHGRNFSFMKHFIEFLGGSRDDSSFSRNAISVHKLYFESHLSLLELLFRVRITSRWSLSGIEHNLKQ